MDADLSIELLYRHVLGREADANGLAHFRRVYEQAGDLGVVLEALFNSPEYRRRHPKPLDEAALSAIRTHIDPRW